MDSRNITLKKLREIFSFLLLERVIPKAGFPFGMIISYWTGSKALATRAKFII